MQRKNGFVMMLAISVMVVMATILALSLSLTNETTKQTTDIYLYEQATFISKSAAEYALFQIAQRGPCDTNASWRNFTQDSIYDVSIDLIYIYSNPSPCTNANDEYFVINTPESSGIVLMDITVSINDTTIASEPIRYFRRTLQKL